MWILYTGNDSRKNIIVILMKDLPIVVKEVLESEDLKNIKRVDGIKETSEALIGALNYIPVVGGGLASELQQIKNAWAVR